MCEWKRPLCHKNQNGCITNSHAQLGTGNFTIFSKNWNFVKFSREISWKVHKNFIHHDFHHDFPTQITLTDVVSCTTHDTVAIVSLWLASWRLGMAHFWGGTRLILAAGLRPQGPSIWGQPNTTWTPRVWCHYGRCGTSIDYAFIPLYWWDK